MTTEPCGCQWQEQDSGVAVSLCREHGMQNRLAQLDPETRDYHLRRLLDAELDLFVREYARGRPLAPPVMALGPAKGPR